MAVADKAAVNRVLAKLINGRNFIFCGELNNSGSSSVKVRGGRHKQGADTLIAKRLQASV